MPTESALRIRSTDDRGLSDPAAGRESEHLDACFALTEVGGLLRYAVDERLRTDGNLSSVQFQILAGGWWIPTRVQEFSTGPGCPETQCTVAATRVRTNAVMMTATRA